MIAAAQTVRIPLIIALLVACASYGHAQIWQLPHDDASPGNHFGSAVSLDGDRLVVGASGESSCGPDAGAAYLYERHEHGTFVQAARVVPTECEPGGFFGRRVALSGDVLAVAAGGELDFRRRNAVYVFEHDGGGAWEVSSVIRPPTDAARLGVFASAVALDGELLVVATAGAATAHGAVHVYERTSGGWTLGARLSPSRGTRHGIFGSGVAIAGNLIAVSASPYRDGASGSVYVFERGVDGTWREQGFLTGFSGNRVPIAIAGPLLVVGEPGAAPNRAGAAAIHGRRDDGRWIRLATLRAHVPYEEGAFGTLVAADSGPAGPRVLVVGYTEQLGRGQGIDRVVHVFGYDGERGWHQRQVLDMGDWAFAMDLDLSRGFVVVGRASDDAPGVAYVVQLLR